MEVQVQVQVQVNLLTDMYNTRKLRIPGIQCRALRSFADLLYYVYPIEVPPDASPPY